MTSDRVYFGHLNELNMDYVKLSNVYYLRVSQQLQPATKINSESTATG